MLRPNREAKKKKRKRKQRKECSILGSGLFSFTNVNTVQGKGLGNLLIR